MSENFRFNVSNTIRKLRKIHKSINRRHNRVFPKEEALWLSHYEFKRGKIDIADDGSVCGSTPHLICSTIDFSFICAIIADAYSIFRGPCYDPVSLFLLDLYRYLERIRSIKDLFCTISFMDSFAED
jgi:hypothetical protein